VKREFLIWSGSGEVEPGGREVKEKSIKVDYEVWKVLKMESLKRGKPVKRVLREILNEWQGSKGEKDLA
jgi:macrodomain Ter protein organizer (MatP/YcbG family)